MGNINWGRVFLGGLLFGVVGGILLFLLANLVGGDLIALARATGKFPESKAVQFGMCVTAMILFGILTIWLYAAIRPRFGPGPKTACIAALATSLFGITADVVWGSLGFVPLSALVPLVASGVPVIFVAALVGAWPYKE